MDISAQAVTLWLRKWWLLGGALLVAVAVGLLTALLVAPVYASSLTARVVETGGAEDGGQADTATYFAESVAGLAATPGTFEAISRVPGLGLTPEEVGGRIEVAAGSTPGFVSVTATGPTPEDAARLATATAVGLGTRLEQDNADTVRVAAQPLQQQIAGLTAQLAALPPTAPERAVVQRQVDGLVNALVALQTEHRPELLDGAVATVPSGPESPAPLRDAAMAFLVALVVLAEGLVVRRAIQGRLVERGSAAAVTRLTGLPAVELDSRETAGALLTPVLRDHLRGSECVTLVQLGGRHDLHLGRVLRDAAGLARPRGDDGRGGGAVPVRIRTVRAARVDQTVIETLHREGGPVVLAVDTARATRRGLVAGLAALAATGADVRAVVVWRGRFPRERDARREVEAAAPAPVEASPPVVTAAPVPGPRPTPAPRPRGLPADGLVASGHTTNGHGRNGHAGHGTVGRGPSPDRYAHVALTTRPPVAVGRHAAPDASGR